MCIIVVNFLGAFSSCMCIYQFDFNFLAHYDGKRLHRSRLLLVIVWALDGGSDIVCRFQEKAMSPVSVA